MVVFVLLQSRVNFVRLLYLLSIVTIGACGGCVGEKGTQGPTGAKGESGNESLDWYGAPRRNWRQCVWNSANGSDNGLIATCTILKASASTAVFAAFSGNTRIYGCSGCCGRWYLTFNNAECSNPHVIDGTVYMANFASADLLRHRTVQGYCNGLAAGWIEVGLYVGACSGYGYFDLYTGWNSISRLIVEEVSTPMY